MNELKNSLGYIHSKSEEHGHLLFQTENKIFCLILSLLFSENDVFSIFVIYLFNHANVI